MAWEHFLYEVDEEGVATLTFHRPDSHNALTPDACADLEKLIRALRFDREVRVLILTGSGRGFCAGMDPGETAWLHTRATPQPQLELARMAGEVVKGLRRTDQPIIAAVNGIAAGAGALLALACDFRIVARSARFHFPSAQSGSPGIEMGAAWLLPRAVGLGRAVEILLLGEPVDAECAARIGLATRVVPDDRVVEEARTLASRLLHCPPDVLAMTKRMIDNESVMDLDAAIESEAQARALLLLGMRREREPVAPQRKV